MNFIVNVHHPTKNHFDYIHTYSSFLNIETINTIQSKVIKVPISIQSPGLSYVAGSLNQFITSSILIYLPEQFFYARHFISFNYLQRVEQYVLLVQCFLKLLKQYVTTAAIAQLMCWLEIFSVVCTAKELRYDMVDSQRAKPRVCKLAEAQLAYPTAYVLTVTYLGLPSLPMSF